MKLDPTVLRTMSPQDFRVLTAVESGMKCHSLVPTALIHSLAHLRHGGTSKILSSLLRDKLLSHDGSCGYDGYRLTNSGYDILALHNLKLRGVLSALGDKIGTGKESDVYVGLTPQQTHVVLKFHRLGRTSFRDVRKKRDYGSNCTGWLFLSASSARKEFAFMTALHHVGYPTPTPVAHNRHVVAMGLVRGVPLYQLHSHRVSAEQAESIFTQSAHLATRLARHGLVHCDLNEFNLMVDLSGVQAKIATVEQGDDATEHYVRHSGMPVEIRGALSAHGPLQKHRVDGTGEVVVEDSPEPVERLESGEPKPIVTLIDFPQMVSTKHANAKDLYERDVLCLKRFFEKKLHCHVEGNDIFGGIMPTWEELVSEKFDEYDMVENDAVDDGTTVSKVRLDQVLKASGYSEEDAARDLELVYFDAHVASGLERDGDKDMAEEDPRESERDGDKDDPDGSNDHDSLAIDDHLGKKCSMNQAPELLDVDSLDSKHECNHQDDIISHGCAVSLGGISQLSHAEVEQRARERVKRHLEESKRKNRAKGAFKTRNSNKSYVKGKRILTDFDI